MTTKQFFSFALPFLLIGGAAGAFITNRVLQQNDRCAVPTAPRVIDANDGSATVGWTGTTDNFAYLVWARDSSKLDSAAVGSVVTTGTTVAVPGLMPNRGYAIDIFGICRQGNEFSISKNPITVGTRTGWIVNEDVYHFEGPGCPFGTCDSLISSGDTCINWVPGNGFYAIEIQDTSSNVLTRYYLNKRTNNDTLRTSIVSSVNCSGQSSIGNPPQKANCSPVNPLRYCGSITLGGMATPYFMETGFTGFCINLPRNKFKIVVKYCRNDVVK